jgi:hypothetical protein
MATKILVLERGMLVEEGTHRELMDKGGIYHNLFATQANRYIAEANEQAQEQPPMPPRPPRNFPPHFPR